MFRIINICITCCWWITLCATADAYPSRNFQQSLTHQNIQSILLSIEERLSVLAATTGSGCGGGRATHPSSKSFEEMFQSGINRLEILQYKFDRFEAMVSSQFQKMAQNFSDHRHQHHHAQDYGAQVGWKIDTLYHTVNHKFSALEMKIEQAEQAIKTKLDAMLKKFEKMEELANGRNEDIESEIGEVLVSLEDLKKKPLTNEGNYLNDLLLPKMDSVISLVNETAEKCSKHNSRKPPEERSTSDGQNDEFQDGLSKLEVLINRTRYEQQNSFRSLVVQVGRLEGKNSIDHSEESSQQLTNLSSKIDVAFEQVINLQRIFLESCQRIQADEPQLDAKIGELLEKMIDIFEKSQAATLDDTKTLEEAIKSHDGNVQRSLHAVSFNLDGLQRRVKDRDEIVQLLHSIKAGLESIAKDFADKDDGFKKDRDVFLKELRREAAAWIDRDQSQVQELRKMLSAVLAANSANSANTSTSTSNSSSSSRSISSSSPSARSIDNDNIKIIRDDLSSLKQKVDRLNEKIQFTNCNIAISSNNNSKKANQSSTADFDLDAAIREVFFDHILIPDDDDNTPNSSNAANRANCSDALIDLIDVRNGDGSKRNSNNCTNDDDDDEIASASEDPDIDIRSSFPPRY